MSTSARVRVLIVDDQALVRAGFRLLMDASADVEVVGEAADGLEAVTLARQVHPDVVLMDIRMPVMDGVEATRILTAPGADPAPRVIILTTFDLDQYVYDALGAGASGFLLKDTLPADLLRAIAVVAAGEARATDPATLKDLSAREIEVLRLIARGLSNAQIAAELFVNETTVKTHVGRVLMKLNVHDRVQAVVFCYESGFIAPGGS